MAASVRKSRWSRSQGVSSNFACACLTLVLAIILLLVCLCSVFEGRGRGRKDDRATAPALEVQPHS